LLKLINPAVNATGPRGIAIPVDDGIVNAIGYCLTVKELDVMPVVLVGH